MVRVMAKRFSSKKILLAVASRQNRALEIQSAELRSAVAAFCYTGRGGVAERPNAPACKAGSRKFESYRLFHSTPRADTIGAAFGQFFILVYCSHELGRAEEIFYRVDR